MKYFYPAIINKAFFYQSFLEVKLRTRSFDQNIVFVFNRYHRILRQSQDFLLTDIDFCINIHARDQSPGSMIVEMTVNIDQAMVIYQGFPLVDANTGTDEIKEAVLIFEGLNPNNSSFFSRPAILASFILRSASALR